MSKGKEPNPKKASQTSSNNSNNCQYVHASGAVFRLFPIRGDGNCLFRSMAYFILCRPNDHQFVRTQIVNYVCSHWDHFQNFLPQDNDIESYRMRMGSNGTYGSEAEIVAFTEIFRCNMVVYLQDHPERDPVVFGESTTDCFVLYSGPTDSGHYDVLMPLSNEQLNLSKHKNTIRELRKRVQEEFGSELGKYKEKETPKGNN